MSIDENAIYKEFNDKLQNDAFKLDTPKKFWKDIEIEKKDNGFCILFDKHILKTPLKNDVILPNNEVAQHVAKEWQKQEGYIKPRTMPLSRLVMTIIDELNVDKNKQQQWMDTAVSYLETDLLLFPSPSPQELYLQEQRYWKPLLDWMSSILYHNFQINEGLAISNHNQHAIKSLTEKINHYNLWKKAAFVTLTQNTGSAIISFAVAERYISEQEAQKAALVQEYYQRKQWGADEELDAQITNKEFEISSLAAFLQNI